MKFVEEEGKTIDDAVEKALKKLNVPKEQVKIEVIEERNVNKKRLFFGFGIPKLVKVKVSLLQNNEDGKVKSVSTKILSKILELMNIKAVIIGKETEDTVTLEIKTEDAGILIGKRGHTLNALQDIITLMVNKTISEGRKRIVLDTEDYRKRRNDVLINLAKRIAQDVVAKKQKIELEPMIPQERYIIHSTLQNHPKVITQSRGSGIERRVVISPK